MTTYNFSLPIRFCPHCGELIGSRFLGGQERPFCASCKTAFYEDPKLAVAVLVHSDGGLVLQRRKIDPGMGKWTFPSGYVERGEPVEDAAIREALEETGLTVRLTGMLGLYSHPGNPVVLAVYSADMIGGVLAMSEESDEVATFPPTELPELAFEHDGEIIETWLRSSGRS
ncbi:MAG: NUDIX domain-containing protein [Nitrolancea sp.]